MSDEEKTEPIKTIEQLPDMPTLDALAVELGIESHIIEGEIVTGEIEQPAPRRSMAEFIPVETLLTFAISVLWGMVQKVIDGAEKVELSDGEVKVLVNGWTPVVEEMMPDIPDGKIEAALMCTVAVAAPKFIQVKKAKKDKAKIEQGGGVESPPGQEQEKRPPVKVVPDFVDSREIKKK